MPGGLTLSQRLTRPDGLPTTTARAGAVALVGAAAALGFAAGPDGGGEQGRAANGKAVVIGHVTGELPITTPEPRPALQGAAALPAFRGRPARQNGSRGRRAAPVAARAPVAAPAPVPPPTPARARSVTPQPVTTAEPPAAVPTPPPESRSTPAPTFDSSG